MTIGRVILAIVALIAAGLGYAYFFASPPMMLNMIDKMTPGQPEAVQVADGVNFGTAPRQQLDVWAPTKRGKAKLPVVIFYYGGAWTKGSRQEYGFAGRAFAGQGFIAVIPDYRLVPGVRFPIFVQDSALAVKWVRDHIAEYGGDPARITLSGHSAGAYNAAMLALDGRFLSDIGVDPKIVRAAALFAGPYSFYPWESDRSRAAFSAWPTPAETQPITYAMKDSPPLLLAQGAADDVVKPRNATRLAKRLTELGARFELKEYVGKSHNDLVMGLSLPFRGNATTLADSVAFLKANSQ